MNDSGVSMKKGVSVIFVTERFKDLPGDEKDALLKPDEQLI